MPVITAQKTPTTKPAVNALLKGMVLNPKDFNITKNLHWGICANQGNVWRWSFLHEVIVSGLTAQGLRFFDYGHKIEIYI